MEKKIRIRALFTIFTGLFVFYVSCMHRSRELPTSVEEKGIALFEEVQEVELSGYKPYNPGVVALEDGYLLVTREKAKSFSDYIQLKMLGKRNNVIKVVELDEQFKARGDCKLLLPTSSDPLEIVTDPRLFVHEGSVYMIFCDHSFGGSVQTLAKLEKIDGAWTASHILPLHFAGAEEFYGKKVVEKGIEKNWMPFSKDGKVCIVYLLEPEQVVLELDLISGECSLVSRTPNRLIDEFSPLRGGTPPLFDEELGEYVTLYHICFPGRASYTSLSKKVYISGACTFTAEAPFELTGRSEGPFYQKELYGNNRTKVIFPTALVRKGDSYIVFYGEDDSKIKVARIPRKKMFNRMRQSDERVREVNSREN